MYMKEARQWDASVVLLADDDIQIVFNAGGWVSGQGGGGVRACVFAWALGVRASADKPPP